ncbi:hypothetical protein CHS0354_003258 [Potamilus streckersoni]|uniref:von Willebrand factor A domain-containing protein 5A-like n=1 Tax=Potamilus streckersoni TaxID=2493646 RepID=A0AAE0SV60_9BIVA|nr:hypothetical protein CHS0354_003258 [Potamilus streckersoni]
MVTCLSNPYTTCRSREYWLSAVITTASCGEICFLPLKMCDKIEGLISSAGNPVPLKTIDVSVTINGFVADVQSTLLYVNTEESPIEAIFTFPLDDQSAVYKFEADIDGRHLIAECHEKEKAKEIYDDAMAFGHTAMLLQQDESAGDIFRSKLGNLPSKAEAKISMGFATELDLEADGMVKCTLPEILNPRYSPAVGGLKPTEKAKYATANAIPYKLSFQLSVRGPQKIKGVQGPKDKLNVDYSEDKKVAKVTLAEEFKFDHDLSVLVEYEACNIPQIVLEKGNPHSGGLLKEDVLMVNFFLEPPSQIPRTNPGEFIFIIDRSGSMGGEKIQSAKETLLLFLKSLPVNCYFNVIGFGSHFESLFQEGSLKYNEENLKKAEELQRQMDADMGGTEILRPLEHIFKQKLIENYPRQLFVLTDGEVDNTAEVLKLAGSNSQHCRVFTVGIGEGASTALVRGLAKAGKGKEVFVTDSERLQPKVISLLQCAMQPVATDIEIIWNLPSPVTRIMMPPKIPYLFLGVRQILYVMLSGTEGVDLSYMCSMTLKGKLVSEPFEYKETFTLHGNTETGISAPIHCLAAKAQVTELQLNDAPKEQIVTVSKSANVISKHTAFVMVDTEGKLVEGMLMEQVVPTPSMGQFMAFSSAPRTSYRMAACSMPAPQMDFRGCLGTVYACSASSGLKMKKYSSPKKNVFYGLKNVGASQESSDMSDLMEFEESEDTSDAQRMMDIIRLQTFQGSWSLDTKLLGMLKTDAGILKQTIPLQDDAVVATVAVIAWLRKHHSERRDEWQMLETKALDWLEGQDLHGQSVEDLISKLNI